MSAIRQFQKLERGLISPVTAIADEKNGYCREFISHCRYRNSVSLKRK